MKLVSVTVTGYRRLKAENLMNLDGKLIAIVGANEAGKSSFLEALQHLDNSNAFVTSGASQEIARGLSLHDRDYVLASRYLIEKGDLEAMSHIEGAGKIKWFYVYKAVSGERFYKVEPRPTRSLIHRKKILQSLAKGLKVIDKGRNKLGEETLEECSLVEDLIQELSELFDEVGEELPAGTIGTLQALVNKIRSSGLSTEIEYLQSLANDLEDIGKKEGIVPAKAAIDVLSSSRPKFLFFDNASRGLKSEYNLVGIGSNPPQALQNLLMLAKLNLSALQHHHTTENQGQVRSLLEEANKNLKDAFESAWSQSNVYVQIDVNKDLLHILVKEQNRDYVRIAERSDGLRQYVALLSFVAVNSTKQKPILLIDEAETHLHYDAQADLVQMLARQAEVAQVIYTTHSIGCLPEDLGMGVRLINADSPTTSVVKNWYWVSDKKGFSPLLFGMGASTMAFMPVRNAVVAEGITDVILLPSLLREVTGKDFLGFQVVSGLSEAGLGNIAMLENESPTTAYLVDADMGGVALRKKLLASGIGESRVLQLPGNVSVGMVLEDFVDKAIYTETVNSELGKYHPAYIPISVNDVPDNNRPKMVEAWCKKQGIASPSKRSIAYGILDRKNEQSIVEKRQKAALKKLYSEIQKVLNL